MSTSNVAEYQCEVCKSVYPIQFDVPVRDFPAVAIAGLHFSGGAPHGPDKACRNNTWTLIGLKSCDHPCMCHGQFGAGYNPKCPCHVSENE